MNSNRTILITGVAGKQGGAVAQPLQAAGFHLRGLTRTPDRQNAAAGSRRSPTRQAATRDQMGAKTKGRTANLNFIW
jgi:nucleoside-diphosphate-sugar epimerase